MQPEENAAVTLEEDEDAIAMGILQALSAVAAFSGGDASSWADPECMFTSSAGSISLAEWTANVPGTQGALGDIKAISRKGDVAWVTFLTIAGNSRAINTAVVTRTGGAWLLTNLHTSAA
jgi:hypothetical protein